MSRTRIKICGITQPMDAQCAVDAGADAIGLVFYEPSPRYVALEQAARICDSVPPFVNIVALTVNADSAFIERILTRLPIDLLQFHGDESPEICEGFARPYIKAISVREGTDLQAEFERYSKSRGLLLDAYKKDVPGGTGETFNWDVIPPDVSGRIVLAGGLHAGNVAQAIATVNPFAVDVSGGVESSPGVKDSDKIRAFITAVHTQDEQQAAEHGN